MKKICSCPAIPQDDLALFNKVWILASLAPLRGLAIENLYRHNFLNLSVLVLPNGRIRAISKLVNDSESS